MTFLFTEDGRDDDVLRAFRRYREYVESAKGFFPPTAYALATSDWYFNPKDHRSPHDAWLESLQLTELSSGERHDIRALSLRLRLLGAYHDGYIELNYPRLFAYRLNVEDGEMGHRDWRYDELRVSDRGRVIHEIVMKSSGVVLEAKVVGSLKRQTSSYNGCRSARAIE